MEILAFLIPLSAAIVVGRDAAERNMNAWGWGIFTFFILILAVPIYLMVRDPKGPKEEGPSTLFANSPESEQMKQRISELERELENNKS